VPERALRTRIAYDEPCPRGGCPTADEVDEAFRGANDPWDYDPRCDGCRHDGTRTVMTETVVEPRDVVANGRTEVWWKPAR